MDRSGWRRRLRCHRCLWNETCLAQSANWG